MGAARPPIIFRFSTKVRVFCSYPLLIVIRPFLHMNLTQRIGCLSIFVSLTTGVNAQINSQLNQADPFTIKSGSSFSASGGAVTHPSDPAEFVVKPPH